MTMKTILAGVALATLMASLASAEPKRNEGSPASAIHLKRLKQRVVNHRNLYLGPMGNTNFGIRDSAMTEPGDFAVTGGISDRSRVWDPTDQVAPGTSNAPCGNCGGE
jgi:hypothetical protein